MKLAAKTPASATYSYLLTYDLYGPICVVFNAWRSIMRANRRGVWPWKSRLFWALKLQPAKQAPFGLKKVEISRAQPPPTCPSNGFVRIKNSTYSANSAVSFRGPKIVLCTWAPRISWYWRELPGQIALGQGQRWAKWRSSTFYLYLHLRHDMSATSFTLKKG